MQTKQLTIVTTAYSCTGLIDTYVDTVRDLGQDRLDWIVIDAGSTDGTAERLAQRRGLFSHFDRRDVDLTEMATRSPVSPHGFHKLAAEDLCDSYARFFGVKVSIVRLFPVYGEGACESSCCGTHSTSSAVETGFFGTAHELRDWIHVDDAARLLCAVASAGQVDFEIYNSGNEHADTRQVLSQLAVISGFGRSTEFNGMTHMGDPRRLTSNCMHTRRQLGWMPRAVLAEGLARYVAWFKEDF